MSKQISETIATLHKLIQTCKDGQEGFRLAAEAITEDEDLKGFLFSCSLQRSKFAGELENELIGLGDSDVPETSTVAAALHRGWIGLKSVITKRDNHAVLAECERGEDAAVAAYRTAMDSGLSSPLRDIVNTQFQEILATHNTVRDMRDHLASLKPTAAETVDDWKASLQEKGRSIGQSASETWEQTRVSSQDALGQVETYVRENPLQAILAAAGVGFAVGLLIRSLETERRDHIEVPIPKSVQKARDFDYKAAVIPFLWPVVKFFTGAYASSRKSVEEAYKGAKDVDVQKYVDPVVKKAKKYF